MRFRDVSEWFGSAGRMAQSTAPRRDRRVSVEVEFMEGRALLSAASVGFAAVGGHWVEVPSFATPVVRYEDPNL